MSDWIDVQEALPQLGKVPYWVPAGEVEEVRSALVGLGFACFATSGLLPASEKDFLRDLQQAFGLEEYGALNWDAFVDAFGDLARSERRPIALLWASADGAFRRDLSYGLRLYEMVSSTLEDWSRNGHQTLLVLIGDRWN
jgi:RNAse (barnase) inhibitor barstar